MCGECVARVWRGLVGGALVPPVALPEVVHPLLLSWAEGVPADLQLDGKATCAIVAPLEDDQVLDTIPGAAGLGQVGGSNAVREHDAVRSPVNEDIAVVAQLDGLHLHVAFGREVAATPVTARRSSSTTRKTCDTVKGEVPGMMCQRASPLLEDTAPVSGRARLNMARLNMWRVPGRLRCH